MSKRESKPRKQDYIVQLIASLNAAEKRYFKLANSLQKGEKKYSRLFDEIARLGQYDADALSQKLKISKKQLADDKNYLQSILLDSVKNFDTSRNQYNHQFLEGLALYDRGLYPYAIDHLNGVIEGAEREELWSVLQSALHIKAACLLRSAAGREDFDILHKRMMEVIDIAAEQEVLRHLSYSFSIISNGVDLDQADLSYRSHPLYVIDFDKLRSVRAQLCWFTLHLGDAMVVARDDQEALRLARVQAEYFSRDTRLLEINAGAYYAMMLYWANAEQNAGNIKKAIDITQNLLAELGKAGKSVSPDMVQYYTRHSRQILAHLYIFAGDYAQAADRFAQVYQDLAGYNEPNQIDILHFYGLSLLFTGRPAEAHDRLEQLLTLNSKSREDLYVSARLLMLLVQYDLGNHAVLMHNLTAAKSFFVRHNVQDKGFLTFIRLFSHLVKGVDKKADLDKLIMQMQQLPESEEAIPFPKNEVIRWLEGKRKTRK